MAEEPGVGSSAEGWSLTTGVSLRKVPRGCLLEERAIAASKKPSSTSVIRMSTTYPMNNITRRDAPPPSADLPSWHPVDLRGADEHPVMFGGTDPRGHGPRGRHALFMSFDKDHQSPDKIVDTGKRTTKVNLGVVVGVVLFFIVMSVVVWNVVQNPPQTPAEATDLPGGDGR
ncbi:MAG: hypothetical protein K0R17_1664 [Rariglobus sp.]|nr:hypothetical protein [Rariglobus sp.]